MVSVLHRYFAGCIEPVSPQIFSGEYLVGLAKVLASLNATAYRMAGGYILIWHANQTDAPLDSHVTF